MFKNIATLALCVLSLISTTGAANVDCKVNGDVVATVDLDTGSCPFTLPPSLPALFNFNSEEDYDIEFYYAFVTKKYFTDIIDAGDVITIPAILLIEIGDIPLFNVHVEKLPTSNSTAALQKRLFKNVDILKRATPSPAFIASLESIDGTPVGGSSPFVLSVSLSNSTSSSASPTHASSTELTSAADTGTVTVSTFATTVITITSCSDHKCTKTTVPASEYLTTETVSGKVTTYTTYCPLFTSTYTTSSKVESESEGSTFLSTTVITKTTLVPVFSSTAVPSTTLSPASTTGTHTIHPVVTTSFGSATTLYVPSAFVVLLLSIVGLF